jgi:hypothetical protein
VSCQLASCFTGNIFTPIRQYVAGEGKKIKFITFINFMGRDSSVGIATRYGLDDSEIESRWGARFSAPFRTGPGAWVPYLSRG